MEINDFSMDYWEAPSAMTFTHVHDQYELYFCVDNVAQLSVINGTEYAYKFPSAILSTPYTVHSMSCSENASSYERYVFYLSEEGFESISALIPPKVTERNVGLLFELNEAQAEEIKGIISCCDPKNKCNTFAEQKLIFALLLNRLFDFCSENKIIQVGEPSSYIQKVVQHIAENLCELPDAEALSREFAVSRSKLDRDFKRVTGISVHQFVEQYRINYAKYLLNKKTPVPIEEVAASIGMDSVNYFFSFFKKHTGMTPSKYRSMRTKKTAAAVKIKK